MRMAREGVIVKHLPAIQNFGSIDVLCSDKTGTLTTGVMQLDRALDAAGTSRRRPLTLGVREQPVRDRHPQPARRRDPCTRAAIDVSGYTKIDEIPFDFERRRLSVVVEPPDAPSRRLLDHERRAGRSMLALATACETAGEVRPLDAASTAGVHGRSRSG